MSNIFETLSEFGPDLYPLDLFQDDVLNNSNSNIQPIGMDIDTPLDYTRPVTDPFKGVSTPSFNVKIDVPNLDYKPPIYDPFKNYPVHDPFKQDSHPIYKAFKGDTPPEQNPFAGTNPFYEPFKKRQLTSSNGSSKKRSVKKYKKK